MSDQNPYQAPGEGGEPSVQAPAGWPKTATVELDEDVVMQALRTHYSQVLRKFLGAAVGICLVFVVGPALPILIPHAVSLPCVLILGIVIFFGLPLLGAMAIVIDRRHRRAHREALDWIEQGHNEVHYEITPTEIHVITDESDDRFVWRQFRRWQEDKGVILLYHTRRRFIILPVEALSTDVADAIRSCLRASRGG
jgi:hypothetical protein